MGWEEGHLESDERPLPHFGEFVLCISLTRKINVFVCKATGNIIYITSITNDRWHHNIGKHLTLFSVLFSNIISEFL